MFDPDRSEVRNRSLLSLAGGADDIPAPDRRARPAATPRRKDNPLVAALQARLKGEGRRQEAPDIKAANVRAANVRAPAEEAMPPRAAKPAVRPDAASGGKNGGDVPNPYWQPLVDPAKVVMGIVSARRFIAAMALAGAILGALVALNTPKQYYAATELLFDPRDIQIVDRDLTRGDLPSDATLALVENQVRIMTSGSVLSKVVERLDLAEDTEFNGQGETGFLHYLTNPRALLSFGRGDSDVSTRWTLAIGNLADRLDVRRTEKTFIIDIGVTTRDAEKSARIANATAKVFLETYGTMQSNTATRANDEIIGRLDELRAAVEKAERAVADFKSRHDIVDAQGRLITDEEILKLNDQLTAAKARQDELRARAASARGTNVDSVVGGALPEQVASPVLAELRAQYASLRQEADRLGNRLGPRHPDRMALEAQLAGARQQIEQELRRVVTSIDVELQRAVEAEQALSARLARLKVQKGTIGGEQIQLRELEREAAARRSVYEAFLLRARETGQQRDLNTANVSVISEAYPPLLPQGPSRVMITLAGLFLGLLAGIGVGAARGAVASFRDDAAGRPQTETRPANEPDDTGGGDDEPDPSPSDPSPPEDPPRRRYVTPFSEPGPAEDDGPDPWSRTWSQSDHPGARARLEPDDRERAQTRAEIEALREELRAFRREVDVLAAHRARRYG